MIACARAASGDSKPTHVWAHERLVFALINFLSGSTVLNGQAESIAVEGKKK